MRLCCSSQGALRRLKWRALHPEIAKRTEGQPRALCGLCRLPLCTLRRPCSPQGSLCHLLLCVGLGTGRPAGDPPSVQSVAGRLESVTEPLNIEEILLLSDSNVTHPQPGTQRPF